jgi:hypothetical protein
MSELQPGVAGRKTDQQSDFLQPLLVPVVEARRLLGGIGNNQFWKLAKAGELELVGTERKRWVVVDSITAYVARMPRRQSKPVPTGELRA